MKYIDYGTMQSEAQRRVLEMQRRAQRAVNGGQQNEAPHFPVKVTDCSGRQPGHSTTQEHYEPTPSISYEPPETECERCQQADEESCKLHRPVQSAAKTIQNDPELALLLAVLLLLVSEKADTILILAILYLML